MPDYFILEAREPEDDTEFGMVNLAPQPPGDASWTAGQKFSGPVPEPLVFDFLPDYPDKLQEMDDTEALLITKRLLAALREAGVDNLDAYPAVIRHPRLGTENHDYVAVNIVGLIAAADLEKSGVTPSPLPGNIIDVGFTGLVLDESKIGGALMFRLAENTSAIVVHRKVREHLKAKGFKMLRFQKPERFIS